MHYYTTAILPPPVGVLLQCSRHQGVTPVIIESSLSGLHVKVTSPYNVWGEARGKLARVRRLEQNFRVEGWLPRYISQFRTAMLALFGGKLHAARCTRLTARHCTACHMPLRAVRQCILYLYSMVHGTTCYTYYEALLTELRAILTCYTYYQATHTVLYQPYLWSSRCLIRIVRFGKDKETEQGAEV